MITISGLLIALLIASCIPMLRIAIERNNQFASVAGFIPGASVTAPKLTTNRKMKELSRTKSVELDAELPDLVELMAVVLASGSTLQHAVEIIATRGNGRFAEAVSQMLARLQLGANFDTELAALCVALPTPGVRDFCNKLSLAISRGTPLAESLEALAQTLRRRRANDLLKQAGSNEVKMLIPLVTLVLPVTVIFALYPSAQVLQLGF